MPAPYFPRPKFVESPAVVQGTKRQGFRTFIFGGAAVRFQGMADFAVVDARGKLVARCESALEAHAIVQYQPTRILRVVEAI